jgi:hypothetical protein
MVEKSTRSDVTYPVSMAEAFPRIDLKVAKESGPATKPPATRQSKCLWINSRSVMSSLYIPLVSNWPAVGVRVQMIGWRPIAREMARTRSSIHDDKQLFKKETRGRTNVTERRTHGCGSYA